MLHTLRTYPALRVHPAAGLKQPQRLLYAVLLRAARWAIRRAAGLEAAAAITVTHEAQGGARAHLRGPPGALKWIDAFVIAAIAAYFVAGLLAVFVR